MLKLYIISQISVNKTQNVFQKKLTIQFNTTTNKKTRIIKTLALCFYWTTMKFSFNIWTI